MTAGRTDMERGITLIGTQAEIGEGGLEPIELINLAMGNEDAARRL